MRRFQIISVLLLGLVTLVGCTQDPQGQAAQYVFSEVKQQAQELNLQINSDYQYDISQNQAGPADRANGISHRYELNLHFAMRCPNHTEWRDEYVRALVQKENNQWNHSMFQWGGPYFPEQPTPCGSTTSSENGANSNSPVPETPTDSTQGKSVVWERFDVNIEIQKNGDFIVTEENLITFAGGTYTFGFREIPTDQLEDITDISVSFDGQELTQVEKGQEPGTFHKYTASGAVGIRYYFGEVTGKHKATLRYRVTGGLRSYEDGDQLWWNAVYADRGGRVKESTMVVSLPEAPGAENVKSKNYFNNNAGDIQDDGQRIIFSARNIPDGQEVAIRVQFPPNIVWGGS